MQKQVKLSILDQSLIPKGGNAVTAISHTVTLAKLAEAWGYHRFWVSEHHNLASIAGSSPEVLITKIASETHMIRVGSGGVMLPNHSALKVAENFRTLEALFPNRIDLGMGRAPGGDKITAAFLNPSNDFAEQSYLRQLDHLQIFFKDEAGTEYGKLLAVPQVPTIPEQWILSSSGGSARIAAQYGMGLAVAKFINGQASADIVDIYKENFEPSAQFPKPKVALSLVVLCADTEEKAMQLKKSINYQFINISRNHFEGISDYEAIKDLSFTPQEKILLQAHMGKTLTGTVE
ncbi:MAG TPA: LLM class flavin-dependent oxidoreductase, partial [Cytophagales bacterium]|nr:LLM class flavin-dependent oxidoreductase [Cytophagales bacterium]